MYLYPGSCVLDKCSNATVTQPFIWAGLGSLYLLLSIRRTEKKASEENTAFSKNGICVVVHYQLALQAVGDTVLPAPTAGILQVSVISAQTEGLIWDEGRECYREMREL